MTRVQLGLFGGTFDPPHLGHLILAGEAAYHFNLERVLWMLAPDPPHKLEQPLTPLPHRLEMLKRTIADNPLFEISYIEINRPGPHYTVDTVHALAEQEPNADITLLMGGDSFRTLPEWRSCVKLVAAVHQIGVLRRPNHAINLGALEAQVPGVTKKTRFVDALLHKLSSSELRQRIAQGRMYRYYLLPAVYDYIEANHLYRER